MIKKYRLEILAIMAIVTFCTAFILPTPNLTGAEFAGSDTAGSNQIANLTGKPVESFSPLVPQWVPPGAEIEAGLFALQAAIGGILVGGVFGYWLGQRKKA